MRPRDRGAIVQVGSALAYRGIPLQTAYCGAKHAIQGFHESLRCELLHEKSNVHVTMVQMPAVNTPQFSWVLSRLPRHPQPVPPIYQPEIVAARRPLRRRPPAAPGVLGRRRRTAATLAANAVAPGLLDRYLGRTGFDSPADRPAARPGRARRTCWSRPTATTATTSARTAIFDDESRTRDPQLWASRHHGVLGRRRRGGTRRPGRLAARSAVRRSAPPAQAEDHRVVPSALRAGRHQAVEDGGQRLRRPRRPPSSAAARARCR